MAAGALDSRFSVQAIPARAGIGLRAPHYRELLATRPDIGWLEVHSENYFGEGGQPLYFLEQARNHYPLSLHGVGLSLGSTDALDPGHLKKLKALIQRIEPGLVSEHLCWSSVEGRHLNDLLPLPYTEEALRVVCEHVRQAQDVLGRQILVENVSSYLQFRHSTLTEWEFLRHVAAETGCGILLDVNNIYVNSVNHGFDPLRYLRGIPVSSVWEIHLAGFEASPQCLIDTHGKPVADPVWRLYREALARFGRVPTLIEWDTDLPALDVLLGEAAKAESHMEERYALAS
ncbi:MAG: MNIO family bufferin maturase [Burkholderiales bacterium]